MANKTTTLTDQIGVNFMEHAEMLCAIHDQDPEEFKEVAEGLGIGTRKAYYLVEIGRAFKGIPLSTAQAQAIGWTKLQLLSKYITPKNYKLLLVQAEIHPVHELKEILENGGPPERKRAVLLYLGEDDYRYFASVLALYGAKRKARQLGNKETALIAALEKLHPKKT